MKTEARMFLAVTFFLWLAAILYGVWTSQPNSYSHGHLEWAGTAALVLDGTGTASKGVIPDTRARGALALGRRLVLRLDGDIAAWPAQWPALPPPLSASTASMPFALDYAGRADFSDVAGLRVRRESTTFDARFRLPAVLAWLDVGASGSPLPPLQGRLRTPRVEIAGAQLDGVQIQFDDPEFDDPAVAAPATP